MENKNVEEYKFVSFQSGKPLSKSAMKKESIKSFEMKEVGELTSEKKEEHSRNLKLEREFAKEKNFFISPIVKEHRGVIRQEHEEKERRIQDEVNKKIAKIEEDAFRKGYEKGIDSARAEVFEQTKVATEEKLEALSVMINEVLGTSQQILAKQKMEIYQLIRNLTKWVLLKELSDDGMYLTRLLEKLILEMDTKNNLLIRVNKKDFETMPEVLLTIEKKWGISKM